MPAAAFAKDDAKSLHAVSILIIDYADIFAPLMPLCFLQDIFFDY